MSFSKIRDTNKKIFFSQDRFGHPLGLIIIIIVIILFLYNNNKVWPAETHHRVYFSLNNFYTFGKEVLRPPTIILIIIIIIIIIIIFICYTE